VSFTHYQPQLKLTYLVDQPASQSDRWFFMRVVRSSPGVLIARKKAQGACTTCNIIFHLILNVVFACWTQTSPTRVLVPTVAIFHSLTDIHVFPQPTCVIHRVGTSSPCRDPVNGSLHARLVSNSSSCPSRLLLSLSHRYPSLSTTYTRYSPGGNEFRM